MTPSPRTAALLEIEALQDELLQRLDELDRRIEVVLSEFAPASRALAAKANMAPAAGLSSPPLRAAA